jgi:ribosomal protein L19E
MTLILDPTAYRIAPEARSINAEANHITRENIDALIDAGVIQCLMTNGRWWTIRRNGRTQTWKRDPRRIRIPFKMGMYGHGAITENDFIDTATTR